MRRKTTILVAAGLVILLAALLVWLIKPKPIIATEAVKVLGLVGEPRKVVGTGLFRLSVVVSNASDKTVEVAYPTLKVRGVGEWVNQAEALDPGGNYASDIRPHGCATQEVLFVTDRPAGEWCLKFNVSGRVTGLNKLLLAKRLKIPISNVLSPDQKMWVSYGEVVSPVFGGNTATNRLIEAQN